MRGRPTALVLAALAGFVSCAPPPPPPPPPVPVGPPTDTVRVPLTDLGPRTYFGSKGGLYPNGLNQPPAEHDSAGRLRRNAIRPLDVNGDEHPFGKYVLLSIGMGNATQEWCSQGSGPPCTSWSLMGRAAADPAVNHLSLVIVNGALEGNDVVAWASPTSENYERIRTVRLAPLGLSENQVQAVWLKLGSTRRASSLPTDTADAYLFMSVLGQTIRTLKVRYPHLQLVFISSRSYRGYAADSAAEPFAYEEGFSVKWVIDSQMNEMRGAPANPRVGSLDFVRKTAPWIGWGPYLWADGAATRSDGVQWERADFEEDGVHPSQSGENKVAAILLAFFKNSHHTRCWFLANQYCL
ncbi:MAG TPA: hypothetical protein VM939_03985 [Gemmatimonadaceae bacterium]|nr:hypothetical protein [Gemmatimonadaceae bacterium]